LEELIVVEANSIEKWNDTGIDLIKDREYKYTATGKWKDWFIECDADGYSNFFMELIFRRTKRRPSAKWFQLVGEVDKDISHTIELGKGGTFIAPENGRLWVYANDASFAYWNNCGCIELTVEELTKQES
jgi:hypothetical protein